MAAIPGEDWKMNFNAFDTDMVDCLYSPIPESKSGTIAARVMIISCRVLRPSLQFCGSLGESVGCGQRTFVPSRESLSLAATASPNSILASLLGG